MKNCLFLFLVLLLIGFAANAQNRCFKAYDRLGREVTKFCAGERITFRDCAGVDADKEYYDYDKADDNEDKNGDGKPDGPVYDTNKYFIYTKPGPVTVTQLGNLNGITDIYAQTFEVVATPTPTFTTTACANKTFRFQITDGQYDFYSLNFGDGTGKTVLKKDISNPVSHTYTQNGPHTVSVTGKYIGGFCTSPVATQTINDLPAYTSPVINTLKVQKQDATTGTIDFTFSNLLEGYTYTLKSKQQSETDFKTVATIAPNQTNYTLASTNTVAQTEYMLEATDACGTILPASTKVANIILTIPNANEQVSLSWQSRASQFQKFELFRNGALLQPLNGTTFSFVDKDVSCGQNHCYEVKGTTIDGKSVSVSAQNCVTVTSTATPPSPVLFSTFNPQNEVVLTLQLPNGQTLKSATYQRSINGSPYATIANSQQLTLSDKLNTLAPVCYTATFTNPCDKTSLVSAPSCPVILTVKLNPDETAQLTWTNYSSFTDGPATYTLELLDENGSIIRSTTVQGNAHTEELAEQKLQLLYFRIKATSKSGSISFSNTETIKLEHALFIPSAFTPNGDGLNDLFEIKGKRFETFTIKVMNSAGQVVYTSVDRNVSWDGTSKSKPQPAGVYAYEVNIKLQDGTTKRRTGTITLIR